MLNLIRKECRGGSRGCPSSNHTFEKAVEASFLVLLKKAKGLDLTGEKKGMFWRTING